MGMAGLGVEKIVGLDVSPGMIQLARELTGKTETPTKLEFVEQDFAAFQSRDRFDAVLAMGFFDYVESPAPVLKRMRTFAQHSVIASFPSLSWYRTPIRKVRYVIKRCPVYFYRRREIERLALETGFARHQITKIPGAGQDYFVAFFN
jgi:SAM-dependent methyltransferase